MNTLISIVIGLVLVAVFAGFALYMGDNNFFKKRQKESGAKNAFERAVKSAATLKNFTVMGSTTISFEGESYTFDALLLSEYGTIAVNAVYAKGDIYGAANDDSWVCVQTEAAGKKEYFANPVRAQLGCVRFFKDLYKAEKVKGGFADSAVVFPFSKTELYVTPKHINAFTLSGFREKLGDAKYSADNKADVQAMKAAIEKYSVK